MIDKMKHIPCFTRNFTWGFNINKQITINNDHNSNIVGELLSRKLYKHAITATKAHPHFENLTVWHRKTSRWLYKQNDGLTTYSSCDAIISKSIHTWKKRKHNFIYIRKYYIN